MDKRQMLRPGRIDGIERITVGPTPPQWVAVGLQARYNNIGATTQYMKSNAGMEVAEISP